jgi:hypothetical protein
MLFQPKIILKQILICMTGLDTRTPQHSSVIAIFHVSQTLDYDSVLVRKVFDHLTPGPFTQRNIVTVIDDLLYVHNTQCVQMRSQAFEIHCFYTSNLKCLDVF